MLSFFHSLSLHTVSLSFPICPLKISILKCIHTHTHTHTQSWSAAFGIEHLSSSISCLRWESELWLYHVSRSSVIFETVQPYILRSSNPQNPNLDLQMQRIKLVEEHLCQIKKQMYQFFLT